MCTCESSEGGIQGLVEVSSGRGGTGTRCDSRYRTKTSEARDGGGVIIIEAIEPNNNRARAVRGLFEMGRQVW